MRRGGDARRRVVQLAGLRLRERDQLAHAVCAGRRVHHQHGRHGGDQRDRREVLAEIERQVRRHRRVDHVGDRAEKQRVAVLRRARRIFGRDVARRARPVLDHELLAERIAQMRRPAPATPDRPRRRPGSPRRCAPAAPDSPAPLQQAHRAPSAIAAASSVRRSMPRFTSSAPQPPPRRPSASARSPGERA